MINFNLLFAIIKHDVSHSRDNLSRAPSATGRQIFRRSISPVYIAASCSSDSRNLELEDNRM